MQVSYCGIRLRFIEYHIDYIMVHFPFTNVVESLCHYPVPMHFQAPCKALARDPQGLPNAERHAAECLSLPCHPQLSDADIAAVISAVNAFE